MKRNEQIALVVVVCFLIAGGIALYFLVLRKKKKKIDPNASAQSDSSAGNDPIPGAQILTYTTSVGGVNTSYYLVAPSTGDGCMEFSTILDMKTDGPYIFTGATDDADFIYLNNVSVYSIPGSSVSYCLVSDKNKSKTGTGNLKIDKTFGVGTLTVGTDDFTLGKGQNNPLEVVAYPSYVDNPCPLKNQSVFGNKPPENLSSGYCAVTGYNIDNYSLGGISPPGNSAQDCISFCKQNNGCTGFVFLPIQDSPQNFKGQCILKNWTIKDILDSTIVQSKNTILSIVGGSIGVNFVKFDSLSLTPCIDIQASVKKQVVTFSCPASSSTPSSPSPSPASGQVVYTYSIKSCHTGKPGPNSDGKITLTKIPKNNVGALLYSDNSYYDCYEAENSTGNSRVSIASSFIKSQTLPSTPAPRETNYIFTDCKACNKYIYDNGLINNVGI